VSGLGASRVAATANNVKGVSLTRTKGAAVFYIRSHVARTARMCAFFSIFHDALSSINELDVLIRQFLNADGWPIVFKQEFGSGIAPSIAPLLVACLVRFLIFARFVASVLGVVLVFCLISEAFAQPLLVGLAFRLVNWATCRRVLGRVGYPMHHRGDGTQGSGRFGPNGLCGG